MHGKLGVPKLTAVRMPRHTDTHAHEGTARGINESPPRRRSRRRRRRHTNI